MCRDSCGRMPLCRSTMAHKCVALALTFGVLGDAARRVALRRRRSRKVASQRVLKLA